MEMGERKGEGREGEGFRERTAVIFDLRRSKGDDLDSLETKRNCLSRGLDGRKDRWWFSFEERERGGVSKKILSPFRVFWDRENFMDWRGERRWRVLRMQLLLRSSDFKGVIFVRLIHVNCFLNVWDLMGKGSCNLSLFLSLWKSIPRESEISSEYRYRFFSFSTFFFFFLPFDIYSRILLFHVK